VKPISTRRIRNRLHQEGLVQASAFDEVFVNCQMIMSPDEARQFATDIMAAAADADTRNPATERGWWYWQGKVFPGEPTTHVSTSERTDFMRARGSVPRPEEAPRAEEAIRRGRDDEERWPVMTRAEALASVRPGHDWNMPHNIRDVNNIVCPPNCPANNPGNE
jgi:hypothetical protein